MLKEKEIINLFKQEVKPALGCTEVGAISLAASLAFMSLNDKAPNYLSLDTNESQREININNIKNITITLDRNVFKNANAVDVPISSDYSLQPLNGIKDAVLAGLFCSADSIKDRESSLTILKNLKVQDIDQIKELKNRIPISIKVSEADNASALSIKVHIDATDKDGNQLIGLSEIKDSHNNIILLSNEQRTLYKKNKEVSNSGALKEKDIVPELTIRDFLSICENLPEEVVALIDQSITVNKELSEIGRTRMYGMGLSHILQDLVNKKIISDDIFSKVKIATTSASDARMGGSDRPAMSVAGSGNQGIIASLPIITYAEKSTNYNKEKLIKALAFSYLLTIYSTRHSEELSAFCGCGIKAGIGATGGLTYYLGGTEKTITYAINNMAATIPGMICDGAKGGCSQKLDVAATVALQSSLIAIHGYKTYPGGIVDIRAEETIKNIGLISHTLIDTDKTMVNDILVRKSK